MEKLLNQEEINAMFRAARGRRHGSASPLPSLQPRDFKQAGASPPWTAWQPFE
jgi:hypothetical protein